jgi:FkbM family methyltransferase
MSLKRKMFNMSVKAIQATTGLLGKSRQAYVLASFVEQLTPVINEKTPIGDIKFYCPGPIPHWRAETLLSKEPETIEWIDGFAPKSIFWDVGANVGVYSLYAARRQDIRVLAFEPSASNYHILSKNIEINKMDEMISGFCMAFSDISEVGYLNMSNTIPGGALSCFGQSQETYAICGKTYEVSFNQGMIGFTIDDFIEKFSLPFPNYLKIDVDSIEDKIIAGATKTIMNDQLKSVLIELDTEEHDYRNRVVSALENAGLKLVSDRHPRTYDYGMFSSIYNHIFMRS